VSLIDHISFRSCCHYLNDQSHQRTDISTRETFYIRTDQAMKNFKRISSMHPYSISYAIESKDATTELKSIWSRMTSLRRLTWMPRCDTFHMLSTQTGLTSLTTCNVFSPHIRYCTNLLELSTPLISLSDYKYMPSSLTRLRLLGDVRWSFDNIDFIEMMNHLPRLASLEFETQSLKAGSLSSLSRWSSLTSLTIRGDSSIGTDTWIPSSLKGLIHNG
jgi:hypothetical protein